MGGLVEEIQRDALNANIDVSTILRKVKVAAAKLRLSNVEDWVESELNGYDKLPLPDYRILVGKPYAFNPYNGWIPIVMANDQQDQKISRAPCKQPISSIEDLVRRSEAGFIEMPLSPSTIRALNKNMDFEFGRMSLHFSVVQMQAIIDRVRNDCLDWALKLERQGIIGENFSFAPEEKERASTASIIYNIDSIGSFNGVMGAHNKSRDISTTKHLELEKVLSLVKQIQASTSELELAGADGSALKKSLIALEAEVKTSEPKPHLISGFLNDIRNALSGAAGSLIAQGALAGITALLSSLPR